LHLFQNRLESAGAWIGVRLRECGKGFSPHGARVTLHGSAGIQERWLVTGDSHRCQHAPVAHFGLGAEDHVDRLEVHWPNGERQVLESPAIKRYHNVTAGGQLKQHNAR
jgi:hypothetical protein